MTIISQFECVIQMKVHAMTSLLLMLILLGVSTFLITIYMYVFFKGNFMHNFYSPLKITKKESIKFHNVINLYMYKGIFF